MELSSISLNLKNFNGLTLIYLIGSLNCLFLAIFTLKSPRNRANFILTLFLMVLGVIWTYNFYYFNHFYYQYPHLLLVRDPLFFLLGPVIYFYMQLFLTGTIQNQKKIYFHFIPIVLQTLVLIPFYLKTGSEKINFIVTKQEYIFPHFLKTYLQILHIFFYLFLSFKFLNRFTNKLKEYYSSNKIRMQWIRNILFSFSISFGFYLILNILFQVFQFHPFCIKQYTNYFNIIVFHALMYYCLKNQEIFYPKNDFEKYEKNQISEQKIDEYSKVLENYMKEEKPWLDSDLNLYNLSQELNISPVNLSQVINRKFKKNFFQYINCYRIKQAKIFLKNQDFKKIIDIAFDSGFNSKSSFNQVFKDFTGMTPSEYRKRNNEIYNNQKLELSES